MSDFKFLTTQKNIHITTQVFVFNNRYSIHYEGPQITNRDLSDKIRICVEEITNMRPYDDTDLSFIMNLFMIKLTNITRGTISVIFDL